MDIAALDSVKAANNGFELELFHPGTMVNLGLFITVLGKDSAEFRKVSSAQNRKRLQKATKGGGFRAGAVSMEEIEQDSIELLAACTVLWRDGDKKTLTFAGKELECTPENAKQVYTDYPWIREQVDAGVSDRANFIKT